MKWPALIAVMAGAWVLLTAGLTMLFGSLAVVPLSAGVVLAALAWVDLRAKVAAEVAEKDEASQ